VVLVWQLPQDIILQFFKWDTRRNIYLRFSSETANLTGRKKGIPEVILVKLLL